MYNKLLNNRSISNSPTASVHKGSPRDFEITLINGKNIIMSPFAIKEPASIKL